MDNFLRQTAAGRAVGAAQSPGPQPLPPVLSGYRTGRLLGSGGSATVWLVEDHRTGTARALKVFSSSATFSGAGAGAGTGNELLALLNRESAVLGALNHPHLLGVHGVVSTDQGPALLMDYAGGGSLLNLVTARGRLGVGECVTVLAPLAQALAYLHGASIQHGDVSPGNVLLTAEGKPLLADLGVVRLLGEPGASAIGTDGFSDMIDGTGLSAYSSDVYSLAAIGWYSLTGSTPGPAKDRVPLTLLVPEVPPELLHILEAGLREKPGERPSAAEMADAVLRSAAPQPLDLVEAVHPSVLPELLTRRATDDGLQNRRFRLPAMLKRVGRRQPIARKVMPEPVSRESGRRSSRPRNRPGVRWSVVVLRAAAALLVLCGALLASPHVLGAGDARSGGPAHEYTVAGKTENPVTPESAVQLSSEMRERLSDADPVKALSALVGVRAMVLTSGDAGLLAHVNVEGSEAMDADRLLVDQMQERGHVFSGLSIRLRDAAPTDSVAVRNGALAVRATAVMSGYKEMDSTGESVRDVAESKPQDLVFVLAKEEGIWKIESVHNKDAV